MFYYYNFVFLQVMAFSQQNLSLSHGWYHQGNPSSSKFIFKKKQTKNFVNQRDLLIQGIYAFRWVNHHHCLIQDIYSSNWPCSHKSCQSLNTWSCDYAQFYNLWLSSELTRSKHQVSVKTSNRSHMIVGCCKLPEMWTGCQIPKVWSHDWGGDSHQNFETGS